MHLRILAFSILSFVIIAITCFLAGFGINDNIFGYMYLTILPASWLGWFVSILLFQDKKQFVYCIWVWLLNIFILLIMLKTSSLYDENLASSKGIGITLLIGNFPATIPFGIFMTHLLDIAIRDEVFSINNLSLPDYQKLWLEITFISLMQGVWLVLAKLAFKRVLSYFKRNS